MTAPPQPAVTPHQDARRRPFALDVLVSLLLGGAAFVLYVLTLAPTVLAGDGGEFQFVPYLLGIAHPTGYPLYTLLGWAWSHLLPVRDVAYRMNLFSAFWAALAVALLYPTARALLRQALPELSPLARRLLAAMAAATFAVTPTFWSQSVIAEVYSLNVFFLVLILYLLLAWREREARIPSLSKSPGQVQGSGSLTSSGLLNASGSLNLSRVSAQPRPLEDSRRFLLLAASAFGLSLTHHSTTVLLAPAILVFVWLAGRRVFRQGRRILLPALLLVVLPLALYLYIPWRAPHTPYLSQQLAAGRELVLYENTPANLIHFIMGGPFSGSLDLSVDLGARLGMAQGLLVSEVGWIGIGLAALGVLGLAFARRWALLALTGLIFAATLAFDLVYTIGDIYVLFIPVYLILALWIALGVGALVRLAGQRPSANLLLLPFFALPIWLAVIHYAAVDQSDNAGARTRWQEILSQPLPSGAVLVSDDRNDIMPMWYFQYVDGQRTDLLGLFPLITPDYPSLGPILDLATSTERPVYLIKDMPGVEIKVATEAGPGGGLWHVVGPAAGGEIETPVNARLADVVTLAGYDLFPGSPRPGETLQIALYWQALHPLDAEYHTFVHLLDAEGNKIAQSDRQPGGVFYPTTLWQPGELLRDDHLLELPGDAPPGTYHLLVGMYSFSIDGTLVPLGEPVVAGEVAIDGR